MKTNKVITTLAMMAALGGSSLTTVSAFAETTPDADTNALTTDSSSTTDSSTAASTDSSTTTDSSTKASTTDSSTATTDATTDTSPAADVKETPAADVKEAPADVKTPATPATPATPQELPQAGDNTTAFAMGMATFAALISVAMVSMKKKMGFSK